MEYGYDTTVGRTAFFNTPSGNTFSMTVMYCTKCGKYYLNYKVLKQYQNRHGGLLAEFVFSPKLTNTPLSKLYAPDTILSKCGYTVKKGTEKAHRQAILRFILDTQRASKGKIIQSISGFISLREDLYQYEDACRCWEEDIMYVCEYEKETQDRIYNPEIKQGGIIRR